MNDKEIIDLYKKGHSIYFITNRYYNYKNSTVRQNYFENGSFVVTKKVVSKDEARLYVVKLIYNYSNSKKEV